LDKLYFNNNLLSFQLCLNEFPETLQLALNKSDAKQIIEDIKNGYKGIHPDLFNEYYNNLKKAPARVLLSPNYGDSFFEMQAQFEANIARFAAYKAYHATQQIDTKRADRNGVERTPEAYEKEAQKVVNAFNRYQVAEYNTAVARARTAKQWEEFTGDETDNEIFPYIIWLPSRSVTRREEHIVFYNKYWRKDSPFWNQNQPGNLWNCKCDWQETDGSDGMPGEDTETRVNHKGLEGNPAITGEIFSDNATYFTSVPKEQQKVVERAYRAIEQTNLSNNYKASGNIVNYENIKSGQILDSGSAYKRMIEHCYGEAQFSAARVIQYDYKSLKNPKPETLGERKGKSKKDTLRNQLYTKIF
jgi:hypothetical protein